MGRCIGNSEDVCKEYKGCADERRLTGRSMGDFPFPVIPRPCGLRFSRLVGVLRSVKDGLRVRL